MDQFDYIQGRSRAIPRLDFVHRYPALLELYREALRAAALVIDLRQKGNTENFDAQVRAAQAQRRAEEEAARAAFRATLGNEYELLMRGNQAARDELNAKLAVYLEELNAQEAPIHRELSEQLRVLSGQALVVQELYRELELPDLQGAEQERLQQARADMIARSDSLRAPYRRDYEAKVRVAFDVHNATTAANLERYNAFKEGPELALKRALRQAESLEHDRLRDIAEARDQASLELQIWARSAKQERQAALTAFLEGGDAQQFERFLLELRDRTLDLPGFSEY